MALHIDCVTQICSTNRHNTNVEHFQHYINISKVFKLNRVAHQYILFKLWLRHKHNTCVTYIVFILDFFHILPKLCLRCIFNQWYNVCTVYIVYKFSTYTLDGSKRWKLPSCSWFKYGQTLKRKNFRWFRGDVLLLLEMNFLFNKIISLLLLLTLVGFI